MKRVSSATADMSKGGGFGVQVGKFEVVTAESRIVEYTKKTGEVSAPVTIVQLGLIKLNDDWQRGDDESVILQDLSVDFTKDGTLRCHPGTIASADAEDFEDGGTDVGAEGNCLIAEDDFSLWAKSGWGAFVESAEKTGFKAEVLASTYLPALIGWKLEVKTVETDKNKNTGKMGTALVVVRSNIYPYDTKKASGKTTAKPPAKGAASTKAAKADDVDIRNITLTAFAEDNAEFTGDKATFQKGFSKFLMKFKHDGKTLIFSKEQKPLLDTLFGKGVDDDAFTEILQETGRLTFDGDEVAVVE